MLADILIIIDLLLLLVAVGVTIVTKIISLRRNRTPLIVNGIKAKAITWGVTASTIVVLLLTYLVLPANTFLVNGKDYDNTFWLKVSNMFVTTSLILLVVAIGAILFGLSKSQRGERNFRFQLKKFNIKR